jgi:hypothetical protein
LGIITFQNLRFGKKSDCRRCHVCSFSLLSRGVLKSRNFCSPRGFRRKKSMVMTDTLCALAQSLVFFAPGTSEEYVFGEFTVLSGSGGLLVHTHRVERVQLTADLRALGAVFAFTQKDIAYFHNHDDVYFVKQPAVGCYLPTIYHLVHGASVPTRVLRHNALHDHPIHVVYTPKSAPISKRRRVKRTRRAQPTRRTDGPGPSSATGASNAPPDDDARSESNEYSDLMDIGKAMCTRAYRKERYKTPNIHVPYVSTKSNRRVVLSHALLVFK